MRYRFTSAAALFALAACADLAPTGADMRPFAGATSNLTLTETIQGQIDAFYGRGFRDAVDARWRTVRQKKDGGNFPQAVLHLNQLVDWIDKKTGDVIAPPGMSREQAAGLLVMNMVRWVYGDPETPPAPVPTGDVAIEFVPAGEPLLMQTTSQHAGVTWDEGSTNEDRIVILYEDPNQYPGHCNGPLVTKRCQYPLFYKLESYPTIRLNVPGKIAVCMVTTGDRRPLEYPADETSGARPVDKRLRIAHDLPANPADYTPNAVQEDGIEILPPAEFQSGELIDCDTPNVAAMHPVERALYTLSEFAARFLSPKPAHALDSGPEHDFSFFSNFNAVDPASQPDLATTAGDGTGSGDVGTPATATHTVSNTSRRSDGHATAAADATTATLWLSVDEVLDESDVQVGSAAIPMLRPDQSHTFTSTFTLPASAGVYRLIADVPVNASYTGEISPANNRALRSITVTDPEIPIALNLTSVEKLPGGTQQFSVTSGSPGPYLWSVNGTDGGSATFGTIVVTGAASALYTAPATVPTPPTFDVCARRAAKPSNQACATVTIKPVPSSGADVVVFNDLNMFDNIFGNPDPNNRLLFANLVTYTGTGPRATMNRVWVHRGHNVRCDQPTGNRECSTAGWSGFESTMRAAGSGFIVDDVNDVTGPLTAIPSSVKVIILALPMTPYSVAEINAMKQFAGEGGRIVFVGEHASFYGVGIDVENDFLTKMGAVMRNSGGSVDCGRNVLPASSLRPHQVTTGLAQLTIACASVVLPGPNDYPLFYNRGGTLLLGAVAKVDLTPLTMAASLVATPGVRSNVTDSTNAGLVAYSWGWGPPPSP